MAKPTTQKLNQANAGQTEAPAEALALRPEVAAVYELAPGKHMLFADSRFGRVDLSEIPLSAAAQFAEAGYLVKHSS
jgi:hypothetical protein